MLPVQWSPEAESDLENILRYMAARNPGAAQNFLAEVTRLVGQLPLHPMLYRQGRVTGTRELPLRSNYFITYAITATAIRILAVVHTRRQYP